MNFFPKFLSFEKVLLTYIIYLMKTLFILLLLVPATSLFGQIVKTQTFVSVPRSPYSIPIDSIWFKNDTLSYRRVGFYFNPLTEEMQSSWEYVKVDFKKNIAEVSTKGFEGKTIVVHEPMTSYKNLHECLVYREEADCLLKIWRQRQKKASKLKTQK